MCKWHILSGNINFKANILLILPLYILKNLRKDFSAIYRQKYNLYFLPSIVWHDARTKTIVDEIIKEHGQEAIKNESGLPISTYFSASKVNFLI